MKTGKLITSLLAVTLLTACGAKEDPISSSIKSGETDAKGCEVYRYSDIIENHETYFAKLPFAYKSASQKPGTVVREDYVTNVYGREFSKYLNVYLPYGYKQEDTSKKYNVIYFQHGDKRSADAIVKAGDDTMETKRMLDNLFDPDMGGITPSIIVFPTLYLAEDQSLAGDNGLNDIPANLTEEYIEDILPLVEGKYNTFTEDASSETGLMASRDHRAFTGYSRGAIFTWRMFQEKLDYFRYWAPMSCMAYPLGTNFGNMGEAESGDYMEAAYQSIKNVVSEKKARNYFIYASVGNKNDMPKMREEMNKFVNHENSIFSYGTDPDENNFFFSVSKFEHTDIYVPYYYYNSLQVFFK